MCATASPPGSTTGNGGIGAPPTRSRSRTSISGSALRRRWSRTRWSSSGCAATRGTPRTSAPTRWHALRSWQIGEAMMLLQGLAILATALFTGAALYVSVVEQPARLTLPIEIAIAEWRPSYRRASVMQASLAVLGTLLGIAAGIMSGGAVWIVAAFMLSAVVPFTLFVMWSTNKRLEDPALDLRSAEARDLLARWGSLHAVRTAISLAALLLMLFARF